MGSCDEAASSSKGISERWGTLSILTLREFLVRTQQTSFTAGRGLPANGIEPRAMPSFPLVGSGGKRGAQNLGMYDYWEDIENIEGYQTLPSYTVGYQFTLTDDPYYPEAPHSGSQVAVFSTARRRSGVTGVLRHNIANRRGEITLSGSYDMSNWCKDGDFHFIAQRTQAVPVN